MSGQIALRAGADGECAGRVPLFSQIPDSVAIRKEIGFEHAVEIGADATRVEVLQWGGDVLAADAGIDVLEGWELAGADAINDALDAGVGQDVGFAEGDSFGGADVLEEFVGGVLVADYG